MIKLAPLKDSRAILRTVPQRFAAQYQDEIRRAPLAFEKYFASFLIDLDYHSGPVPSQTQAEDAVKAVFREAVRTHYPGLPLTLGTRRDMAELLRKRMQDKLVTSRMRESSASKAANRQHWCQSKLDAAKIYTRYALAKRTGLQRRSIDRWWNGERNLSREYVEVIANELRTSIVEFQKYNT